MKKTKANLKEPVYRWLKIAVSLKPTAENNTKAHFMALEWSQQFERSFTVPAMYFAVYVDLASVRFEISANTNADEAAITKYFKDRPSTYKVEVVPRDLGSMAHAMAYQAVTRMDLCETDQAYDRTFSDVIHWFCNMRGYNYLREIRFHAYCAAQTADMLVKNSDKFTLSRAAMLESLMPDKLKGKPVAEDEEVLVLRPGNNGKTISVNIKNLKVGDAFKFKEEWFVQGKSYIQHVPHPKAAKAGKVVPSGHTRVLKPGKSAPSASRKASG